MLEVKQPQKILLVLTRYLGDCLLASGAIRTLRLAYPDAKIDVLVTPSGRWAIEGNVDVDELIVVKQKLTFLDAISLFIKYFRCYDLTITDKPTGKSEFYALLFSRGRRFRVVSSKMARTWRMRQSIFENCVSEEDGQSHRLIRNLKLLAPLNIKPCYQVISPEDDALPPLPNDYVVAHVPASNQLKQWPISNWAQLLEEMLVNGYNIVLTGSPSERDKDLLRELHTAIKYGIEREDKPSRKGKLIDLSGQLSVAQTSSLIRSSCGYVGLDSGITHLASAHNIPIVMLITVAPASMWAPWPYGYQPLEGINSPYVNGVKCQTVNNVTVLQSSKACSPCIVRHCVDGEDSLSPCLIDISAKEVFGHIQIRMPLMKSQ